MVSHQPPKDPGGGFRNPVLNRTKKQERQTQSTHKKTKNEKVRCVYQMWGELFKEKTIGIAKKLVVCLLLQWQQTTRKPFMN